MDEIVIRHGKNGSMFAADARGYPVASLLEAVDESWYVVDGDNRTVVENICYYEDAVTPFFDIVRDTMMSGRWTVAPVQVLQKRD